MKYRNASQILPDELLREVQKYTEGEAIYIPKLKEKKKWGEGSGARRFYEERNHKMREDYKRGLTLEHISDRYALSIESVKRIIYDAKA